MSAPFVVLLIAVILVIGLAATLGPVMRLKRILAKGAQRHETENPTDKLVKPTAVVEFDGLTPEQADEFIKTFRECHSDDV